jgi:alpha-methylacyl-CoA racemase
VLEFGTIGPLPYACMLLSDLGADVVRVDRAGAAPARGATARGRRSFALDLKDASHVECARGLAIEADILLEGFRPGVMERLGLGPDRLLADNPKLVYGRMTGWGQYGPLASKAGHDINFLAVSGALSAIGTSESGPAVPLNVVGDYGGGSLFLIAGVLSALLAARASGRGQVVDCSICDNVISMLSLFYDLAAAGKWTETRETNLLDGGAHFYTTYRCADGEYIAVGAIEPQFYAAFLRVLGESDPIFLDQMNRDAWPEAMAKLQAVFLTRTRDEWVAAFEEVDACVTPVLRLSESVINDHVTARGGFIEYGARLQPAPPLRFSQTNPAVQPGSTFASLDDLRSCWQRRNPDAHALASALAAL